MEKINIEIFSKPYSIIEYDKSGGRQIITNVNGKIFATYKQQNKFIDDDYDGPVKSLRRLTDALLSGIIE